MSPIDPRELKNARRSYVDVIESDRLCGKCRYNLRGLPTNGRCPECGHPIRGGGGRGFRRFSDNLTHAPFYYLKTLALGAWLLALGGIAMSVCFHFARRTIDMQWSVAAGACALVWWVGVYIVTAPRVFGENTLRDEALDGPHLRTINRIANTAWILAAGALLVACRATYGSAMESYARFAASVFTVGGLAGFVTLGLQLAALCEWAGDTGLGERFRVTAWTLGSSILLSLAAAIASQFQGLLTGLFGILALLMFIIGCIALLFFDWALIQLAGMATWAISNHATADETERRMQQIRERREQEMADRTALAIALQDAAPPPELGSQAKSQTAFERNTLDRRSGAANPYDLEPDSPATDSASPKA